MSLVDELHQARWFGGKGRLITATRVVDRSAWVADSVLSLIEVTYGDGPPETYVLVDRLEQPDVARRLLDSFAGSSVPTERGGTLRYEPTRLLASVQRERAEAVMLLRGEQSNTSIRLGDSLIMKLFRRLQFGPNPDVEVGRFLTEHSQFRGTPAVLGSLDYFDPDGKRASLALLQQFIPNRGDAWTTTVARLHTVLSDGDAAESVAAMARLGHTTAELHVALAGGSGDFSAEPIEAADVAAWERAIEAELGAALKALSAQAIEVSAPRLQQRAAGVGSLRGALKIRHHGDYHLGQVLERQDGTFMLIDFEGEPSRPLAQRREKRSPLRDVAGMLRSLDYARNTALRAVEPTSAGRIARADGWYGAVRQAFLGTYLEVVRGARPALLPADMEPALAALELEKAAYEVLYELNNRPDWLPIPLAALRSE